MVTYDATIAEIEATAKSISIKKTGDGGDGRIDSAMKEVPFLAEMKRLLLEKNPDWEIVIAPPRSSYDIMVNSIRINLTGSVTWGVPNPKSKPKLLRMFEEILDRNSIRLFPTGSVTWGGPNPVEPSGQPWEHTIGIL